MRVTAGAKLRLLQELVLHMDWAIAAKATGLKPSQLEMIRRDEEFMERANRLLDKAISETSGLSEAVKRFEKTQRALAGALDEGNMSVAGALMKSHEMEFRMHGLFEKDNGQKVAPVQVNITLEAPKKEVRVVDHEKT